MASDRAAHSPIILIHGLLVDSSAFSLTAESIRSITGREVILVPLLGDKGYYSSLPEFTLNSQTNFVEKFLSKSEFETVDIVGISLGADIALSLATKKSKLIRNMVIINPIFNLPRYRWEKLVLRLLTQPWMIRAVHNLPDNLEVEIIKLIIRLRATPNWLSQEIYPFLKAFIQSTDNVDLIRLIGGLKDLRIPNLEKIHSKTTVIYGERDLISRNYTQEDVTRIPNVQIKVVKDAGHDLNLLSKDNKTNEESVKEIISSL